MAIRFSRASIPWLLVGFRLSAGPVLIGLSLVWGAEAGAICAAVLSLGVLSDIFDGIIARRLKVVTPGLRQWDSRADVIFWVCGTVALHGMHPGLISRTWWMIAALVVLEAVNHGFSFWKFRREASPHHWLSKLFGLGLWALFAQLFLTGQPGWLLTGVFVLGVVSQVEAFAITARLKAWRCDVPSVFTLGASRGGASD